MKKIVITAAVFLGLAISAMAIPSLTSALNSGVAYSCADPSCG